MSVYRQNTTFVEAMKDSWSRNLPLMQVKQEMEEHFGHIVPLSMIREMYRLYSIERKRFYEKAFRLETGEDNENTTKNLRNS